MANTIKIRRSATSGATPTTSQLALGELAINTYDGKLFLKKDNGSASIIEVGGDVTSSTPRKVLLYDKANTGNADSFDGSETRFQLRDENGAIITDIASAYQLLISVDGVVQESNSSSSGTNGYYITNNTASGTDIVFLAAPASGSDFFGTSVTTSNFYVNNISESGSVTNISGLVNGRNDGSAAAKFGGFASGGQEYAIEIGQLSTNSSPGFNATGGASMLFRMNGSEAMRLDASGRLGIGTNTPTRTLTVQGDMNLLSGSSIESDSSSGNLLIQGGSTYPGGCILMGGGSGTNDIRFSTTGNSTSVASTEVMRILSGGGLTFNGDTAQSNGLNDYEEGTFTPYLDVTGTHGSLSIGYTNQVGRYVKIGKTCYVTIDIRLSSFSRGSGTGDIMIKGLPFTPVDSSNYARSNGFIDLYNWDYSNTAGHIPSYAVYQDNAHPWINIFLHRRGHSSTDVDDPSNTSMLFLTAVYETSS
jgi:hypothetical protein|tara:strand:+ start:236 stop:1663 length:1428 start_codon:yes stop_codon:yes gene_type:complete